VDQVGRLFVAVPLEEETRHALATRVGEGPPLPGSPVPPANWHITLRFLGSVEQVRYDRMLEALDRARLGAPFRIAFGGLGAFPRAAGATVLWVAVDQGAEHLSALAAAVEGALGEAGIPPDDRPFASHLTLSRLRPPQDVRTLVEAMSSVGVRQMVTRVVVYRSHLGGRRPARYEELESFPLGG
jgi:RNA 2',3'-cyclic 3'-phosphodiesterase